VTAGDRILKALQDAGERGCTTADLCQPNVGGVRFSARIEELRAAGHNILATIIRQGSWRYTLITDAEAGVGNTPVAPSPPAAVSLPVHSNAGASLGIPEFHCCDSCGHRWREKPRWWMTCPSCSKGTHWISSFQFKEVA
jgi:hypothetical protein